MLENRQNPYHTQLPALNFLEGKGEQGTPNLIITPEKGQGDRYPVIIAVTSIPDGVTSIIKDLHARRFAQVYEWSPAIKAPKPGEITRITTRYFVINS